MCLTRKIKEDHLWEILLALNTNNQIHQEQKTQQWQHQPPSHSTNPLQTEIRTVQEYFRIEQEKFSLIVTKTPNIRTSCDDKLQITNDEVHHLSDYDSDYTDSDY